MSCISSPRGGTRPNRPRLSGPWTLGYDARCRSGGGAVTPVVLRDVEHLALRDFGRGGDKTQAVGSDRRRVQPDAEQPEPSGG